ncbi:MAG TPA: hypothetical protein VGH11_10170 [Jatrophihabitans sp.]|jgi:hypothetical protein
MKQFLVKLVLVGCFSVALVSCKHGTTPAQAPGSSSSSGSAAPSASCVIPQNNGGDHDADNNGGPDDGDGCDR